MQIKLTLLVLTNDLAMVKNLQERTKSFIGEVQFVPLSNGERLAEYGKKFGPDAMLFDDTFIDPLNRALLDKTRSVLSSGSKLALPYFTLSTERPTAELKQIMLNGCSDIFTKPIDASLFFQKLQLHFPNFRFLKDKLLFNMDVDSTLELALDCHLVSASEYGATIQVNRSLTPGDLYTLHGKMFGAADGSCLGRVMSCSARVGDGGYDASLIFIAPSKEILSAIRLWIKQEYIRTRDVNS